MSLWPSRTRKKNADQIQTRGPSSYLSLSLKRIYSSLNCVLLIKQNQEKECRPDTGMWASSYLSLSLKRIYSSLNCVLLIKQNQEKVCRPDTGMWTSLSLSLKRIYSSLNCVLLIKHNQEKECRQDPNTRNLHRVQMLLLPNATNVTTHLSQIS